MAPGLTWQDSADAQVRIALDDWRGPFHLARSHVLYFMLASGLRHLLRADPAWCGNVVSVLAGALTLANLAAVLSLLLRRRVAVIAAAALLACSHTLWRFSTMTETYSLVGALLSGQLLLLAAFDRSRRGWLLPLVGLLNGLAASNHNLALLTLGCYAVAGVITFPRWRRGYQRYVLLGAVAWMVGYAPMWALIVSDLGAGAALPDVISSLLVGRNAEQVFNIGFGIGDAVRLAALFAMNFPTPLLFAALWGWSGLGGRCDPSLRRTFVLLGAVHFLFVARYDIVDQFSFFVPTYVILAVFLGGGIDLLLDKCRPERRRVLTVCVLVMSMLSPVVYAVLPSVARRLPGSLVPIPKRAVPYRDPYRWFLVPWHAGYTGARRFGSEALDLLPPDAFVITDSTLRGPLLYLQNAEGLRKDVRIGEGRWQPFLAPHRPKPDEMRQLVRQGRLFSLAAEASHMGGNKWIATEYRFEPAGPIYRVVPRE
jgi:hypothetical protein